MLHCNFQEKEALTQQQRNRRRRRATPQQLMYLRRTFLENPKPDQATREYIGRQIDMTPRSVQIWFQNNRAKSRIQEKRLAPFYHLPIVTSSCGNNISRVHLDIKSLRKQREHRNPMSWSSPEIGHYKSRDLLAVPSPLATSSGASDHSAFDDDLFSPQPSYPAVGSEASSREDVSVVADDLDLIFFDEHQEPLGMYPGSENSSHHALNGDSMSESMNYSSPLLENCLDGDYSMNSDSLGFTTLAVWQLKIGHWIYDCDSQGLLHFSLSQNLQKIRIEFNAASLAIENIESVVQNGASAVIMEYEFDQISKVSDNQLNLVIRVTPAIYILNNVGEPYPCPVDFTGGEAFCTNEHTVFGDFESLDLPFSANSYSDYPYIHDSQINIPQGSIEDPIQQLLTDC